MFSKPNLQYFLSYLGLFTFFLIIIDKYFFFQISEEISSNFLIYYTLMISVFIGSINWKYDNKINKTDIFYGFIPSLFFIIMMTLNLYNFNQSYIQLGIILFINIQLLFDYILIFAKKNNKSYFYFLRLPLTFMVSILLIIIKFLYP